MSGSSRGLNLSFFDTERMDEDDFEVERVVDSRLSGITRDESFEEAISQGSVEEGVESEGGIVDAESIKNSYFQVLKGVELNGLMDIGNLALWKVSSLKPGCSTDQLRDDDPDTYWQSDGTQPHSITINFAKKVSVQTLLIFTNYLIDESYTPSEILIEAGTGDHDLQKVINWRLKEPSGWSFLEFDQPLKVFLIKFKIKSNHQNGKDTHIRSLKVFQPAISRKNYNYDSNSLVATSLDFRTSKLQSESCVR